MKRTEKFPNFYSGTLLATESYMNRVKSSFPALLLTLLLIGTMSFLYLKNPAFIQNINNNLIDAAFLWRGETPVDERIAIVDVDEKSLHELGQWPWSRNKVATLLQNLSNDGAAIIGMDMVFAEKDNSSPVNIAREANISAENLPDYDAILADTLATTPTITGFTFDFEKKIPNTPPPSGAIYIQKNKTAQTGEALPVAKGVITNIPVLQEKSYSSGSFNTVPDSDGIVRYVPLVISYDDALYPSLSLEIIRTLMQERKVYIFYDNNGVTQINLGALQIPTNAQGKLFVNYHGAQKAYPYLSATDIYHHRIDPKKVEGKIILLGTSAAGLLDLRATPFDNVYPGVEVHATVIDNMLNNDMIAAGSSLDSLITMAAILLCVIVVAAIIQFTPPTAAFALVTGYMLLGAAFYYHILFTEHILLNFAYPLLTTMLSIFAFTFLKVHSENRQKAVIEEKFAKKVSPQVAAQLLKNPKDIFMTSEEEITIFFSDIRNFTTISESFESPKILIDYLNTYMSPMSEIIIAHEGTIDKYIGDAIMAYWNAPLRVQNHADKAVTAAVKQINALHELNQSLQQKAFPPIDIGIGIHTGTAIVGEMGSVGRSDYTVIGDAINLGSRIEGLCKSYGAKILISEATRAQLDGTYRIREVDRVQVKGKDTAVTIFEVLGTGKFSGREAELHKRYLYARRLYKEARFHEALHLFERLHEEEPHRLYALYAERCQTYAQKKIKEFDAVYRFTTK